MSPKKKKRNAILQPLQDMAYTYGRNTGTGATCGRNPKRDYSFAVRILLGLIDDPEITEAFESIERGLEKMTPKEMELWTKQVEAEKKYKVLRAEYDELSEDFATQHLELNEMCETVEGLSEMAGLRQKNRAEILKRLQGMAPVYDAKTGWKSSPNGEPEGDHVTADELLLKLIGDPKISEAFNAIEKWYA